MPSGLAVATLVMMSLRSARVVRLDAVAQQLQQARGVHAGLQRLAHHARRIVQAQIQLAQHVQRTAHLGAHARGRQPVGAQLHKVGAPGDVAARGRDAAARVLDEAAGHQVGPRLHGLAHLRELAVAVVHHHDDVRLRGLRRAADGLDVRKAQRLAQGIAAAALDVAHLRALAFLRDQREVGPAVLQRGLVVLHAPLEQAAVALVARQADDAQQRVVRAAPPRPPCGRPGAARRTAPPSACAYPT